MTAIRDPQALSVPHVLREYALLADGERGVVVGPRGDFSWMCFPRWDSPATFAALIGGQGAYVVTPVGRFVWGGYYETGLIWRNRWTTTEGMIESREALALPSSARRAVLLRRITAVEGPASLTVMLDARADYGRADPGSLSRDDDGAWRARLGEGRLQWAGAADAEVHPDGHGGHVLWLELALEPGESRDLVLVLDSDSDGDPPPDPDLAWSGTEAAWRERIPAFDGVRARREAQHSYAVLSGLTSAGGGMVAAATMALPERAHQGRNYDYRYVWIRDQAITGQAIAAAGPHPLLDDAVRFVRDRLLEHGSDLVPAYTIAGDAVPSENRLQLPGYPGGSDTVGNWVNEQFQLDAFGEALLLFAAADRHDRLDAEGWRAVDVAVAAIRARWREPDAGIWELAPDHWTHSRLQCVAGLRAIALHQPPERAAPWVTLADEITALSSAQALHPDGRWQRSPTDSRIDAALLLPGLRGALPADDPRSVATLMAVERDLARDGYCYRFRPDARPLGESEGAFLLCGLILSLAWGQQGDGIRAARWFERTRAACGPAGLICEEFDVVQRQLRGNLPQAFVHAALLECAVSEQNLPGL